MVTLQQYVQQQQKPSLYNLRMADKFGHVEFRDSRSHWPRWFFTRSNFEAVFNSAPMDPIGFYANPVSGDVVPVFDAKPQLVGLLTEMVKAS